MLIPFAAFAQQAPSAIVSDTIGWELQQADGSTNVRELFTDDQGNIYYTDFQLDAQVPSFGQSLKQIFSNGSDPATYRLSQDAAGTALTLGLADEVSQ